jgi:predicted Rossmann-fold nucleotide-binding protein
MGLLNIAGFYDRLIEFLSHMREHRFVRPRTIAMLVIEREIEPLLGRLSAFVPEPETTFLDQDRPPSP